MRIFNLNKKTPFEVFGIDSNSPDKYKQLFDYMNSYDECFAIDISPIQIEYNDECIENRLLDKVHSISEQILEIYETDKKNSSFAYFKDAMEKIGVTNVTVEDWAKTAAVAFEEEVKDDPFIVPSYALIASYIGYIDLKDNDKFMNMYEDLKVTKEKYKKMATVTSKIANIRDFFDTEIKKLQMEKNEANEEIEREE